MPREGISVYISVKDGASQVLATIGDKTKALDKETQQLAQSQESLRKSNEPLIQKQQALKIALEKSIATVKEAKAAFHTFGDEASEAWDLAGAISEQDDLRRALKETEDQIKGNIKAHNEMRESIRKGAMQEPGGGDGKQTSLTSLAKGIMAGQVGQLLSSSLGGAAEAWMTSAIGTPEAAMISDTVSQVISGAMAGSILGWQGALAGAGLGFFSGLLSGKTRVFEEEDAVFKEYYSALADQVNSSTESMITSGSAIAGGREQTRMAFAKRLGGEDEARDYLSKVEQMAARTNYSYDEITGYSKLLLNSYQADETLGILQTLSDATAGLNLSSSDVNMMISGLSRMRTTGKATQEYLNYFRERGVDVDQALAGDLGVDKSKISDMVTKGQISGVDAAQAILEFMNQEFGGLSDDLAGTYDAMADNLGDIKASLEAAGGEGYNQTRKGGIDEEMEAYSGALGEALKEINTISGQNQAYLENLSEQYQREALSAVLLGGKTTVFDPEQQAALEELRASFLAASAEYEEGSQEAGLKMEAVKEEAQALATAAYESSDLVNTLHGTQLDQISAIRENTAALTGWKYSYELSMEQSKGQKALGGTRQDAGYGDYRDINSSNASPIMAAVNGEKMYGYAYGLDRVPYDDFPALLHEGERVLTAREARAQDSAGSPAPIAITITGNSFTGGGEEMAEQLAEVLARKLEQAATAAVPR